MLLSHTLKLDRGVVTQVAEFRTPEPLQLNLTQQRLVLEERINTLEATMTQVEEFTFGGEDG